MDMWDSNSTGWHYQRRLLDRVPKGGFLVSNAHCKSLNVFGPCSSFVPVTPIHLQLWRFECALELSQMSDSSQLAELPWSDRSTERPVSSGRRSTSPLIASSEMRRSMCDAESHPKLIQTFAPAMDSMDTQATHLAEFHQIEGFVADRPGLEFVSMKPRWNLRRLRSFGGSDTFGMLSWVD